MTYRELLVELEKFSDEQLDLTVMHFNQEEGQYYMVDIVPALEEDSEEILGGPEEVPYPVLLNKVEGA